MESSKVRTGGEKGKETQTKKNRVRRQVCGKAKRPEKKSKQSELLGERRAGSKEKNKNEAQKNTQTLQHVTTIEKGGDHLTNIQRRRDALDPILRSHPGEVKAKKSSRGQKREAGKRQLTTRPNRRKEKRNRSS